jgi:hypothetical protein
MGGLNCLIQPKELEPSVRLKTMKILLVTPYVPSALSAINLAALYFDEVVLHERTLLDIEPVEIPQTQDGAWRGRIRTFVSAIDGRLRNEIQPLINEQIVRIEEAPPRHLLPPKQREGLRAAFAEAEDLLFGHREEHDNQTSFEINESGIAEIHERLIGPLKKGTWFHFQGISTYYEGLFAESIDAALRGEPVLSSSSLLYRMLEQAASGSALKSSRIAEVFPNFVQPRLAMDVLSATLIDSSSLDCRDVLEARYALRDELGAFRAELEKIQFDFTQEFGIEKVFREGRKIANARLSPRVKDIEAWEEHKQVANDGLFFLVKMNKFLREQQPEHKQNDLSRPNGDQQDVYKHIFKWPEDVKRIDDK